MSLTDSICKSAKPQSSQYKLTDSHGLYLLIMPNGSKYWRLKYRFLKKEKLLALGIYPEVSLAAAREKAREARIQVKTFIDPSQSKKLSKIDALRESLNLFEKVAVSWLETQKENWTPKYYTTVKRRLDNDILPYLGSVPISQIDSRILFGVVKKIEERDALHLLKKIRQHCGQIFNYAMVLGLCNHNPALHLQRVFKTKKAKHHPAIEPHEIPAFMKKIISNDNRFYPQTVRAIRLSLLTFVRPTELTKAKRSEIDLEKMEWRLPAEIMKSRKSFVVPLSTQAGLILKKQIEATRHLNTEYVFPHQVRPIKPMSNGTVLQALYRLGMKGQMTAHGFRALARTAIREELGFDADIIEIQLAHKPINPLGEAYDRAKFLKQRRVMMQDWADYIDRLSV